MFFKIFFVLFTIGVSAQHVHKQPKINLGRHFRQLSERRHPLYKEGEPWTKSRKYISDKMYEFGVKNIVQQKFNTTVQDTPVEGVNIIGIKEGENTTNSIIVVGADYSTPMIGNYLKYNTGGVACLLETIHLFMHDVLWDYYHQNFTVIFVAFDLNTKGFHSSGNGPAGAHFFVQDWLIPYLTETAKPKDFLGAVILDSVTTYNPLNETQLLRKGFDKAMPDAAQEIRDTGRKGNYLGLLYPYVTSNNSFISTFGNFYDKHKIFHLFRLQEVNVHLSLALMTEDVYNTLNYQPHYYFWTNKDMVLPAFLLYDTAVDRIDPTPHTCNFTTCNVEQFLTRSRVNFMEATTMSLVKTLLELQTTIVPDSDGSSSLQLQPCKIATALLLMIIAFISSK